MATSYRELVVKGDERTLRGFLWGFRVAKHAKRGLLICKGQPINTHHLRETLRGRGDHEHFITSESRHKSITAAIKKVEDVLEFEIVSDKRISRTFFEFKFETFSKKVATELKRQLRRPPLGVELVDFDPQEHIDEKAKGVEMYSPVHDYKFHGEGIAEGDIEKLLLFHEKLDQHDFVNVRDIVIEH